MELVGYTEDEERQIVEIAGIKDPEALALAKEDFQARTRKEFPEVVFEPNVDTMFAASRVSDREVEKWAATGYPGGYKSGRRPF